MTAEAKTNAMRILEREKIDYRVHTYPCEGFLDGVTVAGLVGLPVETVFKTLVAKGSGGGHFVFVIPVAEELDLKAAARAAGEKSVALIKVSEITPVTGYVRGGCSPVGMKKLFPTYIDELALLFDSITVSGGRLGTQIELSPAALAAVSGAKFVPLII